MRLSSADFGLTKQTVIEQTDDGNIALRIDRKSRIIMADGRKIIEKLPDATIVLKTSAPVCNKTSIFLKQQGIEIQPL